jgi:ligand-binding sensor domain-containing protein
MLKFQDNGNQLWIGTIKGPANIAQCGSFQTGRLTANPIIISFSDDNLVKNYYEQLSQIGWANNKWIGTSDPGLFLVSPQTMLSFYDKQFSFCLITNDIDINSVKSEFFRTSKGMILPKNCHKSQ